MTASPWVSIFSRFTSEALLFEALIIFTLCALYTGFWLLRKRKFGVVQREVPAGVVKYYLNELIVDAELLRSQLFGLLAGQGIAPTPLAGLQFGQQTAAAPAANTLQIVAGDPQSAQTLAALEAKLAEQAKQIENFISEKARVQAELAAAKAGAAPAAAGPAHDDSKLKEKIAQLEAKLAEYSVIEDDLANLKRLQQENAALKAQLGGKPAPTQTAAQPAPEAKESGVSAQKTPASSEPSVAAHIETAQEASASAANETAAEAGAGAAASATQASGGKVDQGAETQTLEKAKTEAATAAASGAVASAAPGAPELSKSLAQAEAGALDAGAFEGLVDQVEASIQKTATTTDAQAPATSTDAKPSTEAAAPATIEKADADLVAEFEKMLNG